MRTALFLLCMFATFAASGGDANERRFIHVGMSEGQLLMTVGKADSESEDTVNFPNGGSKTTKRWIYFPADGDEQTLTTVTIVDGSVTDVKREVSN